MAKYWGFIGNEKYDVGIIGNAVSIFDKNGNKLAEFKDLKSIYLADISPRGDVLAVKTFEGRMAFYSLENMTLIKKLRFQKAGTSSFGNFVFSSCGGELYNIENNDDSCNSWLSVYDMTELKLKKRFFYDEEYLSINCVEVSKKTNEVYLMGYLRDKETKVISDYFVGKMKDGELLEAVPVSEKTFRFYKSYKCLEMIGFTKKAYESFDFEMELEKLKKGLFSLEKLWEKYSDFRKRT